MAKIIITISGKIGSGKSTIAKEISENFNIPIYSFGEYLKYYCLSKNLSTDRRILQNIGEKFIKHNPQKFLFDVINYFDSENSKDIFILDGLRHSILFETFNKLNLSVLSIYLDIDENTRYNRFLSRNKEGDTIKTKEKFNEIDNHFVEKDIESLKPLCSYVLNEEQIDLGKINDLVSFFILEEKTKVLDSFNKRG
ncbi:MAG: ATP-binding protein [Ignavibacteria bacterium]|nr:ATP-binding protein [Ignavibacteria bacterium]